MQRHGTQSSTEARIGEHDPSENPPQRAAASSSASQASPDGQVVQFAQGGEGRSASDSSTQPAVLRDSFGCQPEPLKELCAELDGFNLRAGVRIKAQERSRLEHLWRYVLRPPLSAERLSLNEQGQVSHQLRAPFRDGTTHFVFDPLTFIERLAALVPPPSMHTLTYHGVLAPGASWRSDIVPRRLREPRSSCGAAQGNAKALPCHRYLWPELMRRVFGVDVLKCGRCGSRRRLIALIAQREVIVRILEHLDLESAAPTPAPARSPPQLELGF